MDINSFVIGYKKGKASGGGGGGAELNIAYGDTAPEDTSKLWVKTSEPNGVLVSPEVEQVGVEGGYTLSELPNPLPTKLSYAGCGAVGSKIYIIGGTAASGTSTTGSKSVIIFDTETKTYEILDGVLGTAITNISCAVVGTRIYFFGGGAITSTASNIIRYFDTEQRKLFTCDAVMPTAGYGFGCCAVGDVIYVYGGRNGSTSLYPVYKFETNTEILTTLFDGEPNYNASSVLLGNNIYILGGAQGTSCHVINITALTMTVLRGATGNLWSSIGSRGVVIGDKVFYLGGRTAKYIYEYNFENNSYKTTGRTFSDYFSWGMVAVVDNKAYAFGGSNGDSSNKPLDFAYVFIPKLLVPAIEESSLYIKPQTEKNIFPIINAEFAKIEIGVDSVYKGNTDGIGEKVKASLYKDGAWTTI